MDTKYKNPDDDPEDVEPVISESVLKEVQSVFPGADVPTGLKVKPDAECEDVSVVIASRFTGFNSIILTNIKWHKGRCFQCGHEVVVSDSSPQQPPKMCIECAIKEGKVPRELIERLKQQE